MIAFCALILKTTHLWLNLSLMITQILGSAMSMGACFAQLFKQIGIFDEFVKLGKPNRLMELFDEDLNPLFNLDFADRDTV